MIKVKYSMISVIPSEEMQAPGIIRMERGTNPVNASASGKRETAPLEAMATPRMKHPKLNRESWATSYAQARGEPKTSRPKSRMAREKRMRRERKGRGYS